MFQAAASNGELGVRGGAAPEKPKRFPSEFLAFRLGQEEYGVDILQVQEIRSFEAPTRMFNTPDFILGVVNLRGVIVPIADMRIKFQLKDVPYDSFTVVIVLNIGDRVVGMVVDSVSDVIALTRSQMRPVPQFSGAIDTESVLAIGAVADRMLILLNIEKVMLRAGMDMASWAAQLLQTSQTTHESSVGAGASALAFSAESRLGAPHAELNEALPA